MDEKDNAKFPALEGQDPNRTHYELDQPVVHAKLFQMIAIAYRLETTYTRSNRTAPAQAMNRIIEEINDLLNEIEQANPNFIIASLNAQDQN